MSINLPANLPVQIKLPVEILLSLSTAPLLCLLLGGRAVAIALKELGQTSEELFRGERLPTLKITVADAENAGQNAEASAD